MPVDLGVNAESVERVIRALTDGVIMSERQIVLLGTLAVLRQEVSTAGLGYILDRAIEKLEAALPSD